MHVLIVDCLVFIFLCRRFVIPRPSSEHIAGGALWASYFYEVDFNGELFHTHDGMSLLLVFYSAGPDFCFVRMEYIHINNGKTYLRLLSIPIVKEKS